eukprot:TRINITY_DN6828_c0_g1_i6.p1 TRINITY_DN6828_c0_g1~~TRINITY_DN6828_c0_g1_i6.p1  ORF type:complete len:405 (-),score=78.01 TRINITY_DN6828_c0_g1_i6:194-1408(-)
MMRRPVRCPFTSSNVQGDAVGTSFNSRTEVASTVTASDAASTGTSEEASAAEVLDAAADIEEQISKSKAQEMFGAVRKHPEAGKGNISLEQHQVLEDYKAYGRMSHSDLMDKLKDIRMNVPDERIYEMKKRLLDKTKYALITFEEFKKIMMSLMSPQDCEGDDEAQHAMEKYAGDPEKQLLEDFKKYGHVWYDGLTQKLRDTGRDVLEYEVREQIDEVPELKKFKEPFTFEDFPRLLGGILKQEKEAELQVQRMREQYKEDPEQQFLEDFKKYGRVWYDDLAQKLRDIGIDVSNDLIYQQTREFYGMIPVEQFKSILKYFEAEAWRRVQHTAQEVLEESEVQRLMEKYDEDQDFKAYGRMSHNALKRKLNDMGMLVSDDDIYMRNISCYPKGVPNFLPSKSSRR